MESQTQEDIRTPEVCPDRDAQATQQGKKKKGLLWVVLGGIALIIVIMAVLDYTNVLDLGILGPVSVQKQMEYVVLAEEVVYNADGTESYRRTIACNRAGKPEIITKKYTDQIINDRMLAMHNVTEITYFNDGSVESQDYKSFTNDEETSHSFFEMDKNGSLLKETTTGYDDKTVEYQYDENGNLLEKTVYYRDKEYTRYEYRYNDFGKVEQQSMFFGGMEQILQYEYDENGILLWAEAANLRYEYDQNGNIVFEQEGNVVKTYIYDKNGKLLEETQGNGVAVTNKTIYEYDSAGKLLKKTVLERETEAQRMEYEYDGAGRLAKESTYQNGTLQWYRTYTWYEDTVTMGKKDAENINGLRELLGESNILIEK